MDTHKECLPHLPYGRQTLGDKEQAAVAEVLASGWISRGPKGRQFEARVAEYCGVPYAVAVSSGTAALHLAALAAGLKSGALCWTSPISFVATANCALHAGADVDFVDIDPGTVNLDVATLEAKLQAAEVAGTLPAVVLPVHFSGHSCPMKEMAALAERYEFQIIEDASHALGGEYRDSKIGSCRYAAMAVLSFHPVKSITTGEGGMVLTRDEELYQRLVRLRNNGITKEPALLEVDEGPWYYEQHDLGFNYWMTEFQAALGLCQMDQLDGFIRRRRELAARYHEQLRDLPVAPLAPAPDSRSAHHLMVIRIAPERTKRSRRQVFEALQAAGIGVQVHYVPIPAQPEYRRRGFRAEAYPEALRYYQEALTLPLFPTMRDEDVDRVVGALKEAL